MKRLSNLRLYLPFLLGVMLTSITTYASDTEPEKKSEEQHHFELEVSYNNDMHLEFTGSVYFAHMTKVQVTVDQTGHHFAGVLVRELPFKNSHFGTFFGVGSSFGIEKEYEMDALTTETKESIDSDSELHTSLLVQSGLAYSIDSHWSTGFTVSPGVDVVTGDFVPGATLDLVFAF